ncbi:MAG: T9SS type A sorting domain-containing protein, partial [Candidatus Krumholzibacteria bacterium]|nr:T9SS type A sorting domain-containing protein [Candidatus Krumholzibacteria bacterium]
YDSWPGIQFARVDDSGVVRWRSAVSASPEVAYYTATTISPCSGGALLVWGEWDGHEIIYANKIDTSGAELWCYPEYMWPLRYRKIATSSFSQSSAQVIADGSGGAIVTWRENNGLFARRLDAEGDTLWTPYANPVCSVGAGKEYIQLVGDGSGGAIITWQEKRGSDLDIYAQSIDSNGIIKGPVEGILLCNAVRDQMEPCITGNGADGAIIAWEDDRPDYFTDIYARQVEYDGTTETELLSWSVSPEGVVIRINWTLSSMEEDALFVLSRRNQGDDTFIELESSAIVRDGLDFSASDMGIEPGSTQIYRLTVDDSSGERILFESDPVSVPAMPVTLFQNTPNPFNPSTTIRYFIPERADVTIEIFDVSGRLIEVIANGEKGSGYHETAWSAGGTSSGIYFCRLRAGKVSISRKMVLLR